MPFERRFVLTLPVDVVSEQQTLDFVRTSVEGRKGVRVVTVNAEFVMRAFDDEAFRHAVRTADLATPDGAGILWALRRQGVHIRRRVGGSDLVWSMSEQAARLGHRIFLLGGRPGVADAAGKRLVQTYPGLRIAGSFVGSPSLDDEEHIVDLIRRSKADILFVAFGAPQQELWLARNLARAGISVGMGVGGSLDYLAGTARRAPVSMQDHGLEWLWRLIQQPWRWRRMVALPRFAWLVVTSREQTGERTESD